MTEVHKTADVFGVSRDLPITYVERDDVDDKLLDNLTRDKHVIIYGSSKQGKTCLRRHCLGDDDYILVQCQNTWDIGKLSETILKQAGCEVEISNSRTSDGKSKLQVKAKSGFNLFGLGKAEAELGSEGEQGHSKTKSTEPFELDPSDPNDLVRALKGIDQAPPPLAPCPSPAVVATAPQPDRRRALELLASCRNGLHRGAHARAWLHDRADGRASTRRACDRAGQARHGLQVDRGRAGGDDRAEQPVLGECC